VDPEPPLPQEVKTGFVFASIMEAGQIHSDLTGRFQTMSYRGNKYVLVLHAYGPNNITT
jgi:hypothetical protein